MTITSVLIDGRVGQFLEISLWLTHMEDLEINLNS